MKTEFTSRPKGFRKKSHLCNMLIPVAVDVTLGLPKSSIEAKIHSKINWNDTTIKHFKDKLFKETKTENIEQCVDLLEHIGSCSDLQICDRGESCRKTKSVLAHYYSCPRTVLGWDCPVCQQFQALCQIHNVHCKNSKDDCNVPFCEKGSHQKLQPGIKKYSEVEIFNKEKNNCRLVRRELLSALQTGKKQRVLQLLKSHPTVSVHFFKQLHKWKVGKMSLDQYGNSALGGLDQHQIGGSVNTVKRLGCQGPVKVQAKVLIKTWPLHG